MPEAPAPITASLAGCSFISHMPAVSMMRPSKLVPGMGSETEPVAITTFFVSTSLPSTVILPLPASAAVPFSTSILCFFIRKPTPSVSVFTTLSRCFAAPSISNFRSPAAMPNSAPSRTSDRTSAARSIAFAGMQASFRQRPPSVSSRSTIAVFIPTCAERIAATYPPGPEPITTMS